MIGKIPVTGQNIAPMLSSTLPCDEHFPRPTEDKPRLTHQYTYINKKGTFMGSGLVRCGFQYFFLFVLCFFMMGYEASRDIQKEKNIDFGHMKPTKASLCRVGFPRVRIGGSPPLARVQKGDHGEGSNAQALPALSECTRLQGTIRQTESERNQVCLAACMCSRLPDKVRRLSLWNRARCSSDPPAGKTELIFLQKNSKGNKDAGEDCLMPCGIVYPQKKLYSNSNPQKIICLKKLKGNSNLEWFGPKPFNLEFPPQWCRETRLDMRTGPEAAGDDRRAPPPHFQVNMCYRENNTTYFNRMWGGGPSAAATIKGNGTGSFGSFAPAGSMDLLEVGDGKVRGSAILAVALGYTGIGFRVAAAIHSCGANLITLTGHLWSDPFEIPFFQKKVTEKAILPVGEEVQHCRATNPLHLCQHLGRINSTFSRRRTCMQCYAKGMLRLEIARGHLHSKFTPNNSTSSRSWSCMLSYAKGMLPVEIARGQLHCKTQSKCRGRSCMICYAKGKPFSGIARGQQLNKTNTIYRFQVLHLNAGSDIFPDNSSLILRPGKCKGSQEDKENECGTPAHGLVPVEPRSVTGNASNRTIKIPSLHISYLYYYRYDTNH